MRAEALQALPDNCAAQTDFISVPVPPPPASPDFVNLVKLPTGVADLDHSEIRHDNGQREALSVRESELLCYLAANVGRPVSRDEILQQVWHLNPRRLITRTIDMHIANIREKLRDDPGNPKVLFTVRGEGYMFAPASGC